MGIRFLHALLEYEICLTHFPSRISLVCLIGMNSACLVWCFQIVFDHGFETMISVPA